jgi:hypothetical protein
MNIKMDPVFADAPEPLGMHWRNLCNMENMLAIRLLERPGMMVAHEMDAWYLSEQGECEPLVLVHSNYSDGELNNESSRFDFDLDWVDVEAPDLEDLIKRLQHVLINFDQLIQPLPSPPKDGETQSLFG